MQKKRMIATCGLAILSFCLGNAGQKSIPTYPKNGGDVIALAESLSRVDYSVSDAIKCFGTVNQANGDDEVSVGDFGILLTPSASARKDVKRVVLYTFDNERGAKRSLESVEIDYIKPIQLSYGELVKKYGEPGRLPLPRVRCRPGVNCHPAFVGYDFRFVPGSRDTNSDKRLEVYINLEMEWSKVIPQHSDQDFLAVKSIHFKRIWRSKANAAKPGTKGV
jgi:hypothetical protein